MFISQTENIVTTNRDAPDLNLETTLLDPCFISKKYWISKPPLKLYESISHYLSHQVSRLPDALSSHVQRVCLHAAAKNSEQTYAALLDLNFVLGDKGLRLRKRLLFQCKEVLEESHYKALTERTIQPANQQSHCPWSKYAVLYTIPSNNQIVSRSEPRTDLEQLDVINEARDFLDNGQLTEAQTLLENALIESPERADIATDLLEIYRHTRNKDALSTMLNKLAESNHRDTESWAALSSELDQSNHQLENN